MRRGERQQRVERNRQVRREWKKRKTEWKNRIRTKVKGEVQKN